MQKNGADNFAFGGKLQIIFSEGTASEDLNLTVNRPLDNLNYDNGIGKAFELTTKSSTTQTEVERFNQEVAIVYRVDKSESTAGINDLVMIYFDENLQQGLPLLKIIPDPENGTLNRLDRSFYGLQYRGQQFPGSSPANSG